MIDVDAGTKIYGNWSRANAQKSMAFYCRKSYGYEELNTKYLKKGLSESLKTLFSGTQETTGTTPCSAMV